MEAASQLSRSLSLVFSLSVLLLVKTAVAQQSYQALQPRPGQPRSQALDKVSSPIQNQSPVRFRGWRHGDYKQKFSRPRFRAARPEMASRVESSTGDLNAQPALAANAAMPGFLLRESLPAGFIPTAVVTGDINGDARMDFVVSNGGDNNLWLYLGKGDGSFNLPTIVPITQGLSPTAMAVGHLRGTAVVDIVVAEADSNSVGIFLGNGNGGFTESTVSLPSVPNAIVPGDFNHDGKEDLAVGSSDLNYKNTLAILPGLGNGNFGAAVFTAAAVYAPAVFWLSAADLNNDGNLDLVVTSSHDQIAVQAFLGKGNGSFSAGQIISENFGSRAEPNYRVSGCR